MFYLTLYYDARKHKIKTTLSGRHIDICAERCYGMTKGMQTAEGKRVGALSETSGFFTLTILVTTEYELCIKSSK